MTWCSGGCSNWCIVRVPYACKPAEGSRARRIKRLARSELGAAKRAGRACELHRSVPTCARRQCGTLGAACACVWGRAQATKTETHSVTRARTRLTVSSALAALRARPASAGAAEPAPAPSSASPCVSPAKLPREPLRLAPALPGSPRNPVTACALRSAPPAQLTATRAHRSLCRRRSWTRHTWLPERPLPPEAAPPGLCSCPGLATGAPGALRFGLQQRRGAAQPAAAAAAAAARERAGLQPRHADLRGPARDHGLVTVGSAMAPTASTGTQPGLAACLTPVCVITDADKNSVCGNAPPLYA